MRPKFYQLLIIGLLVFVTGVGSSLAQSTTTHTVESGETLFQIAEQYKVSVQQIKDWNSLSTNRLSIGQKLVIRQQNGQTQAGITHTVKANETLYSISKKYNVSIAEIKKWNDIQPQNLSIGTRLQIYPKKSRQASKGNTNDTQPNSTYTVKSGDSLFRIAQLHNMSVKRLKAINNLSSNHIQVGQKLAVQPTDQPPALRAAGVESSPQGKFIRYTVDEAQTRSQLLEKFRMSIEEFKALNPGINKTKFRRGAKVTMLAPAQRSFDNPYTVKNAMKSLGTITVTHYQNQEVQPTTNGELYNPNALTAAHPTIAMGSVIFIKNETNQRGVFVRINDRTTGNSLKLSKAAWNALALSGNQSRVTMFRSDE